MQDKVQGRTAHTTNRKFSAIRGECVAIFERGEYKPEIIAHEVTQTGGIKLSWNVQQGLQFYVFRNGSLISGKVTGYSWIDESPLANNGYVLYVNYIENGSSIWAYSPTYVVQPTTSHAAPAASPLDTFWAEYDYDGLTIDDEMLSAIV